MIARTTGDLQQLIRQRYQTPPSTCDMGTPAPCDGSRTDWAGLNQHPSNYTPGKRPDNRVAGSAAVLSDDGVAREGRPAGRPIGACHLAINGLIRDGVIGRRSDADR